MKKYSKIDSSPDRMYRMLGKIMWKLLEQSECYKVLEKYGNYTKKNEKTDGIRL